MSLKRHILFLVFMAVSISVAAQEDVDDYLRQGVAAHEEGNYLKAIDLYGKALDILPDSPIINSEMAMSLYAAGSYSEALKYADKAISLRGGNFYGVFLTKGDALRELNRLDEAASAYRQGLTAGGENYMLRYSLGQIYYLQNKNGEASEEFVKALKLQGNHANSHFLLACSMQDGGRRNESLVGFMYYLMMDSASSLSRHAFDSIRDMIHNPDNLDDYLAGITDFLRIISEHRSRLVENNMLGTFWNEFYMPFFDMVFREGYAKVFALHIASPFMDEAIEALKEESDLYKEFATKLESSPED